MRIIFIMFPMMIGKGGIDAKPVVAVVVVEMV